MTASQCPGARDGSLERGRVGPVRRDLADTIGSTRSLAAIEDRHVVATFHQLAHDGGADEARAADDEDAHQAVSQLRSSAVDERDHRPIEGHVETQPLAGPDDGPIDRVHLREPPRQDVLEHRRAPRARPGQRRCGSVEALLLVDVVALGTGHEHRLACQRIDRSEQRPRLARAGPT